MIINIKDFQYLLACDLCSLTCFIPVYSFVYLKCFSLSYEQTLMISKILRHNIIRLEDIREDVRDKSDGQIEEQVLAISVKVYKMSYNSELIYVSKRSSMLEFTVKIKISTSGKVNALIN